MQWKSLLPPQTDLYYYLQICFLNKVTVFNRWGNVVFTKKGYKNKWDGTANRGATVGDGKLPNGTYFYVVKVEKEGKSEVFKGYLELER